MSLNGSRLCRRELLALSLSGIGALVASPAMAIARPLVGSDAPGGLLKLYHIHTTESLEVEYRRGHAVITSALGAIDHLLRDFRTGSETIFDINVLDTLSLLYDRFGRRGRFEIISGFRSPRTNAALRRITTGVAEHSLHMVGRAIDVRLVGTRTDVLRDAALALGRGGVGYYPESNFVHVDSGPIRTW